MKTAPGTALLVTSHFYKQDRRGSMHWLADELVRKGWNVRFLTFGFSRLSLLLGDVRLKNFPEPPKVGRYQEVDGIEQIFSVSAFHPVDLRSRLANRLAYPLFRLFPFLWRRRLKGLVEDCDLIVLESGLPLMLAPLLSRMSSAKLVYRVNDDIRVMRGPPILHPLEMRYAPLFDRISLASPVLAERFNATGKVGMDPMGLDKTAFRLLRPDPFDKRWDREAVCAGTSHFDADAVLEMARLRPNWRFHVIGRLRSTIKAPNIVTHGELPFDDVVSFVQHADVGLAPYRDLPGVEYQAHHSNRLQQYAYCRLPTLAPERMLHSDAPFLIGYDLSKEGSLARSMTDAEVFDRSSLTVDPPEWAQLCEGILNVFEVRAPVTSSEGCSRTPDSK